MAPTTRNQTPSTPTMSKNDSKSNTSTLITPDRLPKTDVLHASTSIPKKLRKQSNTNAMDDTEDSKPAALSCKKSSKSRSKQERVKEEHSQSQPSKKIKTIPWVKKHSEEQVNKFAALYKELEVMKTVAPPSQSVLLVPQVGSFLPPQKSCKAYTYGTFDGCAIYSVYAYLSNCNPAYTVNIRQQIENDEDLMKSLHIVKMVNKRDPHNPFQVWRQPLKMRPQDDGRVRYKYWPIYIRLFENSEDNTAANRRKWAKDFTKIVNDLAPTNVGGTSTQFPAIHIKYQLDMGQSHLINYLTVEDVFFEIK
jgi:hypothetical protein